MANTTNFNWETPDDTDLVKDGAAAIRTLGSAIDTSLVDLKGGTTGQILSKTSNTDMDFTWVANDVGDITAVSAGTGLSGGGTSGAVSLAIDTATTVDVSTAQTLTNKTLTSPVLTTPSISTIDAKGDLIVGSADNTIARLAVGTNGYILTADSTATNGIKWAAAAAGGGKVLQVVQGSTTTATTITTTTYTDSTLSASITPSAATSKILVLVNSIYYVSRSAGARRVNQKLIRGSTDIQTLGDNATYASNTDLGGLITQMYLDSPSTTSSTTYKTQNACGDSNSNSHTVVMQINSQPSTITLIEIGA